MTLRNEATRFAEDLSNEEIKKRIIKLLGTRDFMELEGYLKELAYRRRSFKKRILLEMSEIGELLGVETKRLLKQPIAIAENAVSGSDISRTKVRL